MQVFKICALLLLAANLRAPLVVLGLALEPIGTSLNLSPFALGLLTTLPVLTFAVVSPCVPACAKRCGVLPLLACSMVLLALSLLARSSGLIEWLFLATVLLSGAIAVGNVLLPVLLKNWFPTRIAWFTALFSAVMSVASALALFIVGALLLYKGWQISLLLSLLPALLSALLFAFLARHDPIKIGTRKRLPHLYLWRSPLAWSIALSFGLQSWIFYTFAAWLPALLAAQAWTTAQAAWQSALFQFSAVPIIFLITILAGKIHNQIPIALFLGGCGLGGSLGFYMHPSPWWMVLLGLAVGGCFTLMMLCFNLRSANTDEAAALSAMAQSVGYAVAACGPFGVGIVYHLTGNWQSVHFLLIAVCVLMTLCALYACRPETLAQERARRCGKSQS